MSALPRPPSFADACARVVADPDGDHSLATTLAPLRARIDVSDAATARTADRRALLGARLPADVDRVLELGCGTGTLLDRVDDEYDAVGVDARAALLAFAAVRGGAVARGDPTRPPCAPAFDAAFAFDLAARVPLSALCEGAYGTLRPGGIVLFEALADPGTAARSGVETYRSARYVLERAVDVDPEARVVHAHHRVTDRRTGESGVAAERTPFRVDDAADVRAALEAAGFADVSVDEAGRDGAVVASAVRPVETGAGRRQG